MQPLLRVGTLAIAAGLFAGPCYGQSSTPPPPQYSLFSFSEEITLPAPPDVVYDVITGDISPWWDHTITEKPYKFYVDRHPGGGFYEIFNAEGEGVQHAVVTFAQRGKRLRLVGPLGLAGRAIDLVCTYDLSRSGENATRLAMSVHAAGEIEPGLETTVRTVWHHMLFERLKPYIETGGYRPGR